MEGAMANDQDRSVGYGRPPIATQFKPGVSGNPSGRPKRVKGLKAELLDELGEVMRIREGDSELEISNARAIAKSLIRAAVNGNLRATTALLAFCAKTSGETDEPTDDLAAPEDAEILDDFIGRELRRRASERDVTADDSPLDSHHERNPNNEK
jgi:Family of unknown function (DUF5681)